MLPENFRHFQDSKVLFESLLSLHNSPLFESRTSLEKGFINIQLEKNKPHYTVGKHKDKLKEEYKKEEYSPDPKESGSKYMSESKSLHNLQQRSDNQIRESDRLVEDFFLHNKHKITEENLARFLPQLENKIDPKNHSNAQFLSVLLFLRLCCRHKDMLPENFRQYRDPKVLYEAFTSLSQSHLFAKQTTSLEKGFINRQLEKNKSQSTAGKKVGSNLNS